jgi:hypothetical protein
MQFNRDKEKFLDEVDDYAEFQQKKNSKQSRRKWREIEALKEQKRKQK